MTADDLTFDRRLYGVAVVLFTFLAGLATGAGDVGFAVLAGVMAGYCGRAHSVAVRMAVDEARRPWQVPEGMHVVDGGDG